LVPSINIINLLKLCDQNFKKISNASLTRFEQLKISEKYVQLKVNICLFQAKERELELKNAWSQGRLTKKQTQAKYGF